MKKVHYAWIICFACALCLFCTTGLCINAFNIYMPFIREKNGFTNAQTSTLVMLRNLGCFVSMMLSGFYFKKLSLRTGTILGGAGCVLALVIYGLSKTYFFYCLAATVCGVSYGLSGMIPASMMLGRWFHKDRKLAVGLCTAATGLGVVGVPQALTWLIETYGLRTSFHLQAAVVAILLFVMWLLLRNDPAEKGLLPYGDGEIRLHRPVERHGRMLKKQDWFLLIPLIVMVGVINTCGYTHLTLLSTGKGFSPQTTAAAVSLTGLALIVGKCAYGWVAEKLGTVTCNWLFGTCLVGGLAMCFLANSEGMLFVAFAVYALGLSVATVGLTTWAGELSSPEQYDSTVQRFQTVSTAGALAFSSVPGIVADLCGGSYVPAYMGFTCFAAAAIIMIQILYYKGKNA